MKRSLAVIALALAGCSAPAATEQAPEDTPTPGRYTDAEQADILAESIEIVHGTDPQPAWYGSFIDLTVEDRWAYVSTSLKPSASNRSRRAGMATRLRAPRLMPRSMAA